MNLIFATSNAHKVKEIASVLPEGYTVQSLKDIGFTEELPETRDTIEGNSLQKAEYLAEKLGVTCFSEDTGLEINVLDGRPGVYSARYAGPEATFTDNVNKVLGEMEGLANRRARFKTVITYFVPAPKGSTPKSEGSTPKPPKGGFNTSQMAVEASLQGGLEGEADINTSQDEAVKAPFGGLGAVYYSDGKYVQFTGLCEGTILTEPRGTEGFGYDPIFVPDGCNLSFAEMRLNEKNQYSHRRKAVDAFLGFLKSS
jgi:XTP/dITP diphosphohydrolase